MSSLDSAANLIAAFATIVLAVVAQLFSMERTKESKRSEMRQQLIEADKMIDAEFAFLFFRSRGYKGPNGIEYMHGSDFDSALNKNHTHPTTKTALARVQLLRFLEGLRTSSIVFDEIVNKEFHGKPPRGVWRNKFDSATMNMRLGFEIFEKFYNWEVMGTKEQCQEFFHDAIGSYDDWHTIEKVAGVFVKNPRLKWEEADNAYSLGESQISVRPLSGLKE